MDIMEIHKNSELEIITEGYFQNSTTYSGWLWKDAKNQVSAIMYIWNSGDVEYCVDDEEIL